METVQFMKPRRARGTPYTKFVVKVTGCFILVGVASWNLFNWYAGDHIDKEISVGRLLDKKKMVEKKAIMRRMSIFPIYSSKQINALKGVDLYDNLELETVVAVPGVNP